MGMINVPETAKVVEVVIQNLSPTAHVLHMHGMPFKVINFANFSWCRLHDTKCSGLPYSDPSATLDKCPVAQRKLGDPNHKDDTSTQWGCTYNPATDNATRLLELALSSDLALDVGAANRFQHSTFPTAT